MYPIINLKPSHVSYEAKYKALVATRLSHFLFLLKEVLKTFYVCYYIYKLLDIKGLCLNCRHSFIVHKLKWKYQSILNGFDIYGNVLMRSIPESKFQLQFNLFLKSFIIFYIIYKNSLPFIAEVER